LPRFVYTTHATLKMVERSLAPDVIEKAVLESAERYVDTKYNTLVAVTRSKDRNLVVAYKIEQDSAIIVTVSAAENINRLVERRISKRRWEKFGQNIVRPSN
jgi:hypothetical protein